MIIKFDIFSLKVYSKQEQARRHKVKDKKEDWATTNYGVTEHTKLLLFKMVNKEMLERVNGIVSTGEKVSYLKK